MIYPNPLNPKRYVVINSGMTMREYAESNNALQVGLFTGLCDRGSNDASRRALARQNRRSRFFGEMWQVQPDDGK